MSEAGRLVMALPVLERTGICQPDRCGAACCRALNLEVNPVYRTDPDIAAWVRLHGIELSERDGRTIARIPLPCTALGNDGRCSLYSAPGRPDLCAAFPDSPAALDGVAEVCSYMFR